MDDNGSRQWENEIKYDCECKRVLTTECVRVELEGTSTFSFPFGTRLRTTEETPSPSSSKSEVRESFDERLLR